MAACSVSWLSPGSTTLAKQGGITEAVQAKDLAPTSIDAKSYDVTNFHALAAVSSHYAQALFGAYGHVGTMNEDDRHSLALALAEVYARSHGLSLPNQTDEKAMARLRGLAPTRPSAVIGVYLHYVN